MRKAALKHRLSDGSVQLLAFESIFLGDPLSFACSERLGSRVVFLLGSTEVLASTEQRGVSRSHTCVRLSAPQLVQHGLSLRLSVQRGQPVSTLSGTGDDVGSQRWVTLSGPEGVL